MPSENTTIQATDGGAMPCYLSTPDSGTGPGVVIIPSIMGVAADIEDYANRMAAAGFTVCATDPFWRDEDPGSLDGAENARDRAFARMGRVDQDVNMGDLESLIADLKSRPTCNGKVAVMGFCFGGSYAYLGAARLGTAAGIAFHSGGISQFLDEGKDITCPLSWHWGDNDHAAPPEEREKVGAAFDQRPNAEMVVYPGGVHGFMHYTNPDASNEEICNASWARAMEVLKGI